MEARADQGPRDCAHQAHSNFDRDNDNNEVIYYKNKVVTLDTCVPGAILPDMLALTLKVQSLVT